MIIFNYFLIFVIVILAIYIAVIQNHINALLAYGIFGAALSAVFFILNAPDVAIVEITVGAAFIFFIYLIAIKKVGKVKVYYVLTPYLVEKKQNKLTGFEYAVLNDFIESKGLDVEYIEVKKTQSFDALEKNGDILIGGHINSKDSDILYSDEFLPTKLISIGTPDKTSYGYFIENLKVENDIEKIEKDFLVDLIRYKYLLYLGKTFENNDIKETKTSGYKVLFNSNNDFLREEFNEFIEELKKDKDKYEDFIRRYIG